MSPSPATQTHADDPHRRETVPLSDAPSPARRIPKQIGRYRIDGELGRGGVGVVYEAWDTQLERAVALKTLIAGRDASENQVQRFQREVRATAHFQHPHIVSVHDAGSIDGCFYLAMEKIDGEPLDRRLDRAGRLGPRETVALLLPIVRALDYAHDQGIVHRDVKPENILIDERGQAYLTDFGLALDLSEVGRLTQSHQSLGTPAFMAPEQMRGSVKDPRVDIYSIGATLYECITGQVPYPGDSLAQLMDSIRLQDPIPPRRLVPSVAPDLEAIVLTCLEKNPARRYAHAAALTADLEHFLAGEAVAAVLPGVTRRLGRWFAHQRPLFVGVGLAVLGVLGGVAYSQSVDREAAAARRQQVNLEAERQRLLVARREALERSAAEQAKSLAFVQASLATTTKGKVEAYDAFLERYPNAWGGRVARAQILRVLCHELRARDTSAGEARAAALRALEDLDQAAEGSEHPAPILLLRGELLRVDLKDRGAATVAFERLASESTEVAWLGGLKEYALARLAFWEGRDADAHTRVLEALALRSDLTPALLLLSEIRLDRGETDSALEGLDGLAGNVQSEAEVVRLRGEALRRLGSLEDARRDALRAVELDPQDPVSHLLLGRVRLMSSAFGQAAVSINRGLKYLGENAPERPNALVLQAWAVLGAWGDLPKALNSVSEAREAGSVDAELVAEVRALALAKAKEQGVGLDPAVLELLGEEAPAEGPDDDPR
jgi:tetratricopeptide (TPR) repeat protein